MPFVSEAQRRLMYAAAAGKKTKADISQAAAKKLVSEDEPGKLPEKVSKAEGDGSDMAKQLLSSINEMSAKLNEIINSDEELEDWVDAKIVSAKQDLEAITSYLQYNENRGKLEMSIHGSDMTPDRTVARVDGIAKADDLGDYEKKAQGALDFKNQMKQFRREHGSTILDIAGGRKIDKARADAYHAARGNLMVGHGVSHADIPPRIPSHLIHSPAIAEPVQPPALPAAKSMEALTNPKSLLAKVDGCMKCMRKSSEEGLEKSAKKSKPFHGYNKKKHARSGGLNDSYRKKLNRETGSNLKRPVTKKNVKPGSKAAKRRKSFCARMSGVKGPTSKDGKLTPKGAALKRWRCSKSLNKSESVPLELRAQKVLQKYLDKSNSIKPFGENIYDATANLGRKMGRTGEEVESVGGNKAVQQYGSTAWGSSKEQAGRQAKLDQQKSRKNPVVMLDLKEVPDNQKQEVIDAFNAKKDHPLLSRAVKVLNQKKQKAEKSLEKKFSLKGALTAGAIGTSALASGAQASPESDLHSQLSNLNVMGEYHTPKGGSQAILKEPSQLKADPSHPSASYSREAGSSSSMGNFYGPDAAKAKQLLQNYDAASSKPFAKNDKLAGGKGDSRSVADFDPLQVKDGKKVELEHTKDPAIAQEITKDHLSEDPKYYSKLKAAGLADELKKAHAVLSKLEKRCWEGYKPVPGKKPYSKGSCEPVGKSQDTTNISAPAMESGKYQGEKLDAHHHNRLGREYKQLALNAHKSGDKSKAASYLDKASYHFSMAQKKGYAPQND